MNSIKRVMLLQRLRRQLMAFDYAKLSLEYLPKLRAEVEGEYQKLATEKGEGK